jgi:hypothetical protein
VTTNSNAYCAAFGIHPPRIEDARSSSHANHHSLLLVALLECSEAMTLVEPGYEIPRAEVQLLLDGPGGAK